MPVITPAAAGGITGWRISPSSDRIVYTFGQDGTDVNELYSVPPDGSGTVTRLNGGLVTGGSVSRFDISPDGSRVVYQADEDVDEVEELYAATLPEAVTELKLFLPVSMR